ncbi:MAG: NlpC/P60 family protein, partial [Flaviflexus sp.]|nr:NlpC/P60 family protein [Flaviflexus sp.]
PAEQAAPAPAPAAAQQAAPAPAPAPAAKSSVVGIARQYAGSAYRYGGATPAGFDCSGFTSYVYAQVGVSLPRSSAAQRGAGVVVPASQAQPGDLLWWPGHVGIYTGNGQHIAARNPRAGVAEGPIYGNPLYIRVR